ncbi:MAG: hypothetical protein ABIW80_00770, partial [Lapillicoccus sp.]
DSTTAVATDQAKQVGQDALQGGQHVAGVAVDQAKSVAGEAGTQAKNLLGEARSQLTDQAGTQQNNLAAWLHTIVEELDQMVNGGAPTEQSGPATALVRQVSERTRGASTWLQDHEPADLLAQTSRFARQRPGMFLALAAVGGVLAGRLTRGLTADAPTSSTSSTQGAGSYEVSTVAVATPVTPVASGTYAPVTPVADDAYLVEPVSTQGLR